MYVCMSVASMVLGVSICTCSGEGVLEDIQIGRTVVSQRERQELELSLGGSGMVPVTQRGVHNHPGNEEPLRTLRMVPPT